MSEILSNSGFTGMMTKAGLLPATGSKLGVGFSNPEGYGLVFAINGVAYGLANDAETSFSAMGTQAAGTVCLILVQVTTTGDVTFKKGAEVTISAETVPSVALELPMPDVDYCPVGCVKMVNATNPFIYGTTAVDATGVTDTYFDFAGGIPHRPVAFS